VESTETNEQNRNREQTGCCQRGGGGRAKQVKEVKMYTLLVIEQVTGMRKAAENAVIL